MPPTAVSNVSERPGVPYPDGPLIPFAMAPVATFSVFYTQLLTIPLTLSLLFTYSFYTCHLLLRAL